MENHKFRENISDKGLRKFFNERNNTPNKRYKDADYTRLRNQYFVLLDAYRAKQKKDKIEKQRQARSKTTKTYYKQNLTIFDYKKSKDPMKSVFGLIKKFAGKSIVMQVIQNGVIVESNEIEVGSDFNNWWKSNGVWYFQKSSDETIWDKYEDAIIYFYLGDVKLDQKKILQFFKEGDVNCLLKPILSWANSRKEDSKSDSAVSRYNAIIKRLKKIEKEIGDNGVGEAELIRISNEAQIDISIEKPIVYGDDKYVIESKSSKKPLKHIIMRNTKFNHVQISEHFYTTQDELICLNNIEEVSREELNKIKNNFDRVTNEYYEFKRDLTGLSSISTLEKTWRLSNDFMNSVNEMEIAEGLNECYIDDIDNKNLSAFVKMGTHYNATIDFQVPDIDQEGLKHMDMKNAYASYKNCPFYVGFLGKITDWRKTTEQQGVGLYQIHNLKLSDKVKKLNDKLKIYYDMNIYPSCELFWLESQDCTFDIMYGCWGVTGIDFDMEKYPFLFEKYDGVKGYAKYVGMCDSHYLTKKFSCYGDENLAKTLDNCTWYSNNEITISYPKKHNYHFGHFTAFIVAYQRLQMLDQLLHMDQDNLVRVCVDGIYYTGDETLNVGFFPKTKMTFDNVAGDSYVSNICDLPQYWECGEDKEMKARELYIGQGGNGKTHKNLTDKGLIRTLYIAPSWKLATKKRIEYGIDSEVWANILTSDPEKFGIIKRRYNVFVIDEVSMMQEEQKNSIFERFPNIKLIFCGDIGFQAPPFSTDATPVVEITHDGFDEVYTEKQNYRYKCNKLIKIVEMMRSMIEYGRPDQEVNNYVKEMFQKINNDQVKEMYKIDDMILSRSHKIKDTYTEMFKDMEKWYVTKNTRMFKNGEIIIGNKPDTTCEIRHAYTIHSIQGETAEHKLFINMENRYDSRLLYTAISRARKANQIYLIVRQPTGECNECGDKCGKYFRCFTCHQEWKENKENKKDQE
jgi:hypothetical protein